MSSAAFVAKTLPFLAIVLRSPDYKHAPNTDGLDISATNVHIRGVDIMNGGAFRQLPRQQTVQLNNDFSSVTRARAGSHIDRHVGRIYRLAARGLHVIL